MLLRFTVENWMSFRDVATLSMIATSEKQHSEQLAKIDKYNVKLLPAAVIYGGNASGKSNLVKAMSFAQEFIVTPPKAGAGIRVKPFRLRSGLADSPTKFCFEILVGSTIYEYSFSVTSKRVIEEELKKFSKTSEEVLFRRKLGDFNLLPSLPEQPALKIISQGTQDNQLYLTNTVSQKRKEFLHVFRWFVSTLVLIYPESHYGGLPEITKSDHIRFQQMTARLSALDSGISSLNQVEISIEDIPKYLIEEMEDEPENNETIGHDLQQGHVFLRKENGIVVARKLDSIHKTEEGTEIPFSLQDESDGTRRLLDLLPAFLMLEERHGARVCIIDELDRSLHYLLTKNLLETYLSQCDAKSRSQLIFTTHNLQLMDQSIFRRDEIWVTERERSGGSKLTAFSEYRDIRKDKDIRKSYLQGRMGGIPKIDTSCRELQLEEELT